MAGRPTFSSWISGLLLLTGPLSAQPSAVPVCIDFECDNQVEVTLQATQWRQVGRLFEGVADAADERRRLIRYVALMEQFTGEPAGTWRDRGRNDPNVDPAGQLDCIAESTNTDRYLRLLARNGLLQWHNVQPRQVRHRWLFSPHWTAVIRDRQSGEQFAVDSWFRDNGSPPFIVTLAEWRSGKADPED